MQLRKKVVVIAFLIALAACCIPHTAHALNVQIQTQVRPLRIVVVDNRNKILLITSNTSQDVLPEVHRGKLTGPIMPLKPAVKEAYYYRLQRADTSRPGILYRLADTQP